MIASTIAGQLETRRAELGQDQQFVERCLDGRYGSLASQVAIDVVAGSVGHRGETTATVTADALIAEVRQTEQDTLRIAA